MQTNIRFCRPLGPGVGSRIRQQLERDAAFVQALAGEDVLSELSGRLRPHDPREPAVTEAFHRASDAADEARPLTLAGLMLRALRASRAVRAELPDCAGAHEMGLLEEDIVGLLLREVCER